MVLASKYIKGLYIKRTTTTMEEIKEMKKTLQECKEMVAEQAGCQDWATVKELEMGVEDLADLANKIYYEQSECESLKAENERLRAEIKALDEIIKNFDVNH